MPPSLDFLPTVCQAGGVINNVAVLVYDGVAPFELGVLHDAALVVESGRVAWVGPSRQAPAADTSYDLGGRAVVPGFVDSHSHLMFAGDRAEEFAARMTGTPYSAGGIRTTVGVLHTHHRIGTRRHRRARHDPRRLAGSHGAGAATAAAVAHSRSCGGRSRT